MRMTDMLLTETPRPILGDKPFTEFINLMCGGTQEPPVVIEATDVAALFMEMSTEDVFGHVVTRDNNPEERKNGTNWQVDQFFAFDFTTLGNVAPPFTSFVIEVDVREAMQRVANSHGIDLEPRQIANVGKTACAFTAVERDRWIEQVHKQASQPRWSQLRNSLKSDDMASMMALPYRWMYVVTTYLYQPGVGLRGPAATWLIPVDADGNLFMYGDVERKDPRLIRAFAMGPVPTFDDAQGDIESDCWAVTQGWMTVLPALLAVSLLHTPKSTPEREGYHDLLDGEAPPTRMAKKYLQRNFRPMVTWKTIDITPLRKALREAHGGRMPHDWVDFKRALHVVRGHSATYMPNTYFGRKHDRPITVFRPSYRRGDVRAGVVQKEYRVSTEV